MGGGQQRDRVDLGSAVTSLRTSSWLPCWTPLRLRDSGAKRHLLPPPRRVRWLIITVTLAMPPAKLSSTF